MQMTSQTKQLHDVLSLDTICGGNIMYSHIENNVQFQTYVPVNELFMMGISASQMKELGVVVYNCSCLVADLQRIFALYSSLKNKSKIPSSWSKRLYAVYDTQKKLTLNLNETQSKAFISVSSFGECLLCCLLEIFVFWRSVSFGDLCYVGRVCYVSGPGSLAC